MRTFFFSALLIAFGPTSATATNLPSYDELQSIFSASRVRTTPAYQEFAADFGTNDDWQQSKELHRNLMQLFFDPNHRLFEQYSGDYLQTKKLLLDHLAQMTSELHRPYIATLIYGIFLYEKNTALLDKIEPMLEELGPLEDRFLNIATLKIARGLKHERRYAAHMLGRVTYQNEARIIEFLQFGLTRDETAYNRIICMRYLIDNGWQGDAFGELLVSALGQSFDYPSERVKILAELIKTPADKPASNLKVTEQLYQTDIAVRAHTVRYLELIRPTDTKIVQAIRDFITSDTLEVIFARYGRSRAAHEQSLLENKAALRRLIGDE